MRQKSIYVELWKDPDFAELKRASQLLAIYAMTNPNIKLYRAFRLSDREIMFDTGLNTTELEESKEELKGFGILFVDNYCILKTEYAPFKFKGSKLAAAIETEKESIPEKVIKMVESDTLSIPYGYPIDRVNSNSNRNSSSNSSSNNKKKKKEKKEKKISDIQTFEKSKKELVEQAKAKYSDKDVEKAFDDMLEYCKIQGKSYKDFKLAYFRWVREDRFNQYKKKKSGKSIYPTYSRAREEQFKKEIEATSKDNPEKFNVNFDLPF